MKVELREVSTDDDEDVVHAGDKFVYSVGFVTKIISVEDIRVKDHERIRTHL